MWRLQDLTMLASVVLVVLLLSHNVHGAPTRDDDIEAVSPEERYNWSALGRWLSRNADLMERIRRTHIDAGFLSRHNAMANYLKAIDAQRQASNPYGPGRRK